MSGDDVRRALRADEFLAVDPRGDPDLTRWPHERHVADRPASRMETSDHGGSTSVVLFSMTANCKYLDIDSFAHLREILGRLPSHPAARLEGLLPAVLFALHPSGTGSKTAA